MSTERPTTTQTRSTEQVASELRSDRKPYVAPQLRHLGSVRDLTLGTSNRLGEGGRRNM
ncbi:MAG: lasso RiPP family leader peptide-containing protein [Deltaproteobacteria bacterium]|nr:lasso RiPP family leader peptide-containing protein [Deltaproteobacteria bacterium]